MAFRSMLDEVLEGWRDVRNGLIDEVRTIPANRFDFRPTPEVKDVRELIQHILEVAMMMTEELNAPGAGFHRVSFPTLIKKHGWFDDDTAFIFSRAMEKCRYLPVISLIVGASSINGHGKIWFEINGFVF